jgi:hypothetical protein
VIVCDDRHPLDTLAACFRDLAQIIAHKAEFKPNQADGTVAMVLDFRSTRGAQPPSAALRQMEPQ